MIMRGDSVAYNRAFGVARLDDREKICDTTLFNIGNSSKQYSAVALMKLKEDGLISLDDSISKYLYEFRSPAMDRVTPRQVLSFTSGIPEMRPTNEKEWNEYASRHKTAFSNLNDYRKYALARESTKCLEFLDSLDFEPGTAYEYETLPYQLILRILENVTGKEYVQWMDSVIFRPNGLERTSFITPLFPQNQFAHAYRPVASDSVDAPEWQEYDYGEVDFFSTKPDVGLFTSASDYLKWAKALFDGKIVSKESVEELIAPVAGTDLPRTFSALGFFVEHMQQGRRKIYNSGNNGGFGAATAYFPETGLIYLVFSNRSDFDVDAAAKEIDRILKLRSWI